jgi:hypothetical protein
MASRSRIIVTTVIVWGVVVAVCETIRILGALDSGGNRYDDHLGFQLIATLFLIVTRWVVILAAALLLEILWFLIAIRLRPRRGATR